MKKTARTYIIIGLSSVLFVICWTYAAIVVSDINHYEISAWTDMPITWGTPVVCKWISYNQSAHLFIPKKTAPEWNAFVTNAPGSVPTLTMNSWIGACEPDAPNWCIVGYAINSQNDCIAWWVRRYTWNCKWACSTSDLCLIDIYDETCTIID